MTRNEAITFFEHLIPGNGISAEATRMAIEALKAEHPKKGSWDYGTQCSVCKGTIIPPKDRKVRVNFCPWCGADMRGGYDE